MRINEARTPSLQASGGYDLHTHSTFSDGTETPSQIAVQALEAHLQGIALTDHDTTAGWAEASQACQHHGIEFLPGMEITTKFDGHSTHLLAYGFDASDSNLNAELERVRESRLGRAQEMVQRLSADFDISWEAVYGGDPSRTVGRPHIADVLVEAGYFADRGAAFATVLSTQSPYYVHTYAIDTAVAVRLVCEAGGVAVLAHPAAARHSTVISDESLARLVAAGLWGIELHHPESVADRLPQLFERAKDHGLLVTGASDYHGTGKVNRLGEHRTDESTWHLLTEAARQTV